MKRFLSLALSFSFVMTAAVAQVNTAPNGDVGIGITPQYKLDVNGAAHARGSLISFVDDTDIGGSLKLINAGKNSPGMAKEWVFYNMGGIYGNSLQLWVYDYLSCANGGLCAPRFTITDDGNVGIGTQSPAAKLTVNGGVLATKVKVNATLAWPDYVFEPSYALPSLRELERYILQYKHLPDVPSAKEVEANGLDLGDNQAALLKKIEELTLYMIAQDKKMEAMQEEINRLKNSSKQ